MTHHYAKIILLSMGIAATTQTISTANAVETHLIAGVYPIQSEGAKTRSLIDLDQVEMENYLTLDLQNNGANWLEKAESVFQNGKHSGPYAKLHLTKPLDHTIDLPKPIGSVYIDSYTDSDSSSHKLYELNVVGVTDDSYQTPIHGTVQTAEPDRIFQTGKSDKILTVDYPPGSSCNADGIRDDCFAGPEGGAILQGYGAIDYTYDPVSDNKFRWTLSGYSQDEGERMYYCEHHGGCGHFQEYEVFYNYYGILDYGNHWIEAAFASTSTDYTKDRRLANGNVDFSVFSKRARNAAIVTATVTMNVFTAVNRLMVEYALEGCKKQAKDYKSYGNSHSMDSVLHAWDQAVATYSGSALLQSPGGSISTSGALYYRLVENLAKDFGVLQPEASHKSVVNQYILDQFVEGKAALTRGDCTGERHSGGVLKAYLMILHKMRTPWVQGLLRSAFVLSHAEDKHFDAQRRDEERGRGAAFLAALLPELHLCSPGNAERLYEEMNSNRPLDYSKIRDTLEFLYECLGVTCDEVGGFLNPSTGDYYAGTHPCGGYGNNKTQRRDSVAYNTVAEKSSSRSSSSSSSSSFNPSSKTKGFVASSFFMIALTAFGLSMAVLVVTVRDVAQGRPINLTGTAQRLASGTLGTVDNWLDRGRINNPYYSPNQYSGYELHTSNNLDNDDYDVQLRSMPSSSSSSPQFPLRQPLTSNEDFLL